MLRIVLAEKEGENKLMRQTICQNSYLSSNNNWGRLSILLIILMWGVFPPLEKQRKTDRVQICRYLTPSRSYLCPIPGHLALTQPVDHPDWI